ncbi:MAG: hypothetical protein KJ579_00745 [Verrucomicrobia bacterium]|nr:hypothetical protein [Verrucomicrobiota bacterium]
MSPDPLEEGLARLRTVSPSPALRTRVLALARDEWTLRSAERLAFRAAAWRRATAVAAVWAACVGFTLHEDGLTSRAFAASRPAATWCGDDREAAILKESGLNGAWARLRTVATPDPSNPASWAMLRTGPVL